MTSRMAELAARRAELVARSRALREEFRDNAERIYARISWADRVISAGRALRRSGPILLGVAAVAVLVGPMRLFRLLGTAYRYAPTALGAYQVARRTVAGFQDRSRG